MRLLEAIKKLFPRNSLFNLNHNGGLRRLSSVLARLGSDMRSDAEQQAADLYPFLTNRLSDWEKAFKIQFTGEFTDEQRRKVLSVFWWMRWGSSTIEFIQQVLSALIPGIVVEENNPVRNPDLYAVTQLNCCGNENAICGRESCVCGYHEGEIKQYKPDILHNDSIQAERVPADRHYWELCFFICGGIKRENNRITDVTRIAIPRKWKKFIEYIILLLKPVHTTAFLFVDWVEWVTISEAEIDAVCDVVDETASTKNNGIDVSDITLISEAQVDALFGIEGEGSGENRQISYEEIKTISYDDIDSLFD